MLLILRVWLIAAMLIGASGVLGRLPVPPPAIAVSLTILLLLLLRFSGRTRAAAWSLGARALVGFHVVRIVAGAYFLILYSRGVLPGEFAVPAGWGDIVVGAAAIVVLVVCLPASTRARRTGLLVWNTAGLLDILSVLGNGARLFAGNAGLGEAFTALPLSLLPTFVVPLVIVSHVLLFGQGNTRSPDPVRQ